MWEPLPPPKTLGLDQNPKDCLEEAGVAISTLSAAINHKTNVDVLIEAESVAHPEALAQAQDQRTR